jgi:hypothetical protein
VNGPRHPEADQVLQRLRQEGIAALFHFTSVENLGVIRDMSALCSKQVLEDAGRWPPPEPGGDDLSHSLDRHNDNWDKISLTFTPHTPMAYRKKPTSHLCFFVVDVSVAGRRGVIFTDTNAASIGQQRAEGLPGLDLVNFNAVRAEPQPWDRDGWVRPVQAEILVPNRITFDHVREVGFVSHASLEEARRIWGDGPGPTFVRQPQYFSDSPGRISINFPYLDAILLTDALIDESSVKGSHAAKTRFSRGRCDRITIVANVHALAGTNATVTWRPVGVVQTTEFETPSDYRHWPSIPMQDLPNGRCSVEYRLGQVRWATLEFEVVP